MSAQMSHDTRQSRGRDLALAPNTIKADQSAIKFLEAYRSLNGKRPFNEMTFIEIENDNLENFILSMALFASSTPIPRYYANNFEPPQTQNEDEPIKILATTTLSKYIGKILKMFQYKWPEHEDFKDLDLNKTSDVPEFWTRLRPQFEKSCDRYHHTIGNSYSLADTTKRALYLSNPQHLAVCADDVPLRDYLSKIDLQYILKNLIMKTNIIGHQTDGKLQHRLIIALIYHCCGRGGEVKFVDTSDWVYHPPFGCTDIVWTELKTVMKQAMPMFPNKTCWLSDFYHCLGSYFAVEHGLFRTHDHKGIESYLFPSLHSVHDNYVTSKVTGIIRNNLPPGTPRKLQTQLSAKSTRRAAVSFLLTHPALHTVGDVCGRTGHKTETSLDYYNDTSNIARGMRGGKALAQWSVVTGGVQVPRFTCLGEGTARPVQEFIKQLFVTSLNEFKPGGSLYCVLEICAASLVMHHTTVTKELGPGNVISTRLRDCAMRANISDPAFPLERPETIIDRWSEKLMANYRSRNTELNEATPDIRSLAVSVNQQSSQMNYMSARIQELTDISQQRDAACETQRHQMNWYVQQLREANQRNAQLVGENTRLREDNAQLRCQLSIARSNNAYMQSALQSPVRTIQQQMQPQQQQQVPLPPPLPPPPPMQQQQQQWTHHPQQPPPPPPPFPPPRFQPMQQQQQQQQRPSPPPPLQQNIPPPPPRQHQQQPASPPTAQQHQQPAPQPPLPQNIQQQQQQPVVPPTQQHLPQVPPLPPRPLIQTSRAAQVQNPSNKGKSLSTMLVQLYEENGLRNLNNWKDIDNSNISSGFSHKSYVKYSLELCQYVMDDDEVNLFKEPNSFPDRTDLLTLAADIELRAFRKMYEFEGDDPDVAIQVNNKTGSNKQKKPLVGGIGPRVQAYKKILPGGVNGPLQERPPAAAEQVGTPPGNTSITAFVTRGN